MKINFQVRVFLVVAVLKYVTAFGGSEEKFIKKYAMMKVYESCFGSQVLSEIRREMKDAAQKCSGMQSHFDDKYFTKDGTNIKNVPNSDWMQEPPQRLKPSLGNKVKKPIHTTDTLLLQQWTEEQKQSNADSHLEPPAELVVCHPAEGRQGNLGGPLEILYIKNLSQRIRLTLRMNKYISHSSDHDQSEAESLSGVEIETASPVKKPVDFSKLEEAIMNIGKPMGTFGSQKHGSANSNFQQSAAVGYYPAMYYPPPVPFAPSYPFHPYYPGYFQTPGPAGSAAFQSYYRSGLRAAKITNFNRNKKQTDVKPQIDFSAFQYSTKMRNISCIMQELGYLDENLEPNYLRMTERINRLYITEELKKDMLDGVKFCRQFSQCVPDTRKDSFHMSKELLRPMFFFRCYKHKKLESCIMKDIRERFSQTSAELNNEVRRSFRNNDLVGSIFESVFGPGEDDYEFLL